MGEPSQIPALVSCPGALSVRAEGIDATMGEMTGDLEAMGWGGRWPALYQEAATAVAGARPGRVVRHDGVAVLVATEAGTESLAVHGSVDPAPVVGDYVVVSGDDQVVALLPRSGLLRREDPGGGEQPIAANIDAVLVVCGLDRPVKAGRIQRSVALAWDADAVPVVVLTKADLHDDTAAVADDVAAAAPGVDVILVSTVTGAGIDEVRAVAAGKTILFLGESGAGKSTLANALVGDEIAATGEVRAGDSKGRHTTTARQLHPLPGGGVLVDTPGIRSVGLWVDADAVVETFDDIDELATGCRFTDCAHDTEPGCAVRAAVADGTLAPARLDAWRLVQREAIAAARRANPHERHQYERSFGRMVKEAAKRKRPG
jgi:ribosome biogenesis GTPase